MKLYTNTAPYLFSYEHDKGPVFLPIGTTFAMVGFDNSGVWMQLASSINNGESLDFNNSRPINPELLKLCFKEVEFLKPETNV